MARKRGQVKKKQKGKYSKNLIEATQDRFGHGRARPRNQLYGLLSSVSVSLVMVFLTYLFSWSDVEQRPHFLGRLFCMFLMDSTFGQVFACILIHPARALVRFAMPPALNNIDANAAKSCAPTDAEGASNDDTLPWPRSEVTLFNKKTSVFWVSYMVQGSAYYPNWAVLFCHYFLNTSKFS